MRLLILMIFLACLGCTTPSTPAPEPILAPDFTLSALDGTTYTLSQLSDGWVIINFWATWCAPCVEEMPLFQQITDDYAVTILGVNMREEMAEVQAFIEQHNIRYPILLNPDDDTLIAYNVVGLPQTLIIAPGGELVYRSFGPVTIEEISEVLER
jgi:thiol-disulfide isomerase/thioredoxin